ncbi:MAG: hypothetical protein ABIJ45_09940 [Candidatus Zixiibacteriota bacterium]
MSKNNVESDLINRTINYIAEGKIELIDFDKLGQNLKEIHRQNLDRESDSDELVLLKYEYASRIIGMAKANLACRPNDDEAKITELLSGNLNRVGCTELINYYQKTAARFRNNFPASFKYLGFPNSVSHRKNWREHKI